MNKPAIRQVYVETSVWGMVAPGQNPALRQPTLEFFRQCERGLFLPCLSEVVVTELEQAPEHVRDAVEDWLARLTLLVLPLPNEARDLAQRFVADGVLPPRRLEDGLHVACALVNGVDLLVSWNYRHLANISKADGFNAVAVLAGLRAGLEIHTPFEVLQWK